MKKKKTPRRRSECTTHSKTKTSFICITSFENENEVKTQHLGGEGGENTSFRFILPVASVFRIHDATVFSSFAFHSGSAQFEYF